MTDDHHEAGKKALIAKGGLDHGIDAGLGKQGRQLREVDHHVGIPFVDPTPGAS